MRYLDENHYKISLAYYTIQLLSDIRQGHDCNPITNPNSIHEFYISFITNAGDLEFGSYQFTYDPNKALQDTIKVSYWEVTNSTRLAVYPNLNTYYFMNDKEIIWHTVIQDYISE